MLFTVRENIQQKSASKLLKLISFSVPRSQLEKLANSKTEQQ